MCAASVVKDFTVGKQFAWQSATSDGIDGVREQEYSTCEQLLTELRPSLFQPHPRMRPLVQIAEQGMRMAARRSTMAPKPNHSRSTRPAAIAPRSAIHDTVVSA